MMANDIFYIICVIALCIITFPVFIIFIVILYGTLFDMIKTLRGK